MAALQKRICGSWYTISWNSQWCIIVEMEAACVQDCIWSVSPAGWGKWLLFSLHHFSKATSLVLCLVQGFPVQKNHWEAEVSLGVLMWLRAWSRWNATKAWDAWRRGISSLPSTATRVVREDREADASWAHCQEGPTVDTDYGKEDSVSLWEINKSTPHEDGLALEESPRKMKGSLSWQTSAGQGLCHLIELWCCLSFGGDSDVQKSLPT